MDRPTRVIEVDAEDPAREALAEAAEVIRAGGLVAFATETVYGLGADATNPDAVARIYAAKGRPAFNPLIVHVVDGAMARDCVAEWPAAADALAAAFWPGPLTLILPRSGLIPDIVTAGHASVGVRVPSPAVARGLIAAAGRPIAAPSANRSTGVSPTLARHVLKDLAGRIELILDSGRTAVGLESTVLDLTARPPRVLRPGAITAEQIAAVLGEPVEEGGGSADRPVSPGQMDVHYAPRARAIRLEAEALAAFTWPESAALIVLGGPLTSASPAGVRRYDLPTPEVAACELYHALHECDEAGVGLVVIVPPPDRPEWRAVRDRVGRATREA